MEKAEQLEKLSKLLKDKVITQEEFDKEKKSILSSSPSTVNNEKPKKNSGCMSLIALVFVIMFAVAGISGLISGFSGTNSDSAKKINRPQWEQLTVEEQKQIQNDYLKYYKNVTTGTKNFDTYYKNYQASVSGKSGVSVYATVFDIEDYARECDFNKYAFSTDKWPQNAYIKFDELNSEVIGYCSNWRGWSREAKSFLDGDTPSRRLENIKTYNEMISDSTLNITAGLLDTANVLKIEAKYLSK